MEPYRSSMKTQTNERTSSNRRFVRTSWTRSGTLRSRAHRLRRREDRTKGKRLIYDLLAPKTADALRHTSRLHRENSQTGSTNPATRVHELVNYLIALRPV
jgi:hypothetical protein